MTEQVLPQLSTLRPTLSPPSSDKLAALEKAAREAFGRVHAGIIELQLSGRAFQFGCAEEVVREVRWGNLDYRSAINALVEVREEPDLPESSQKLRIR